MSTRVRKPRSRKAKLVSGAPAGIEDVLIPIEKAAIDKEVAKQVRKTFNERARADNSKKTDGANKPTNKKNNTHQNKHKPKVEYTAITKVHKNVAAAQLRYQSSNPYSIRGGLSNVRLGARFKHDTTPYDMQLTGDDRGKLEERYIQAIENPGTIKTVPPFNDATEINGVIPLVLSSSEYRTQTMGIFATSTTNPIPITNLIPLGKLDFVVCLLCPISTAMGSGQQGHSSGVIWWTPGNGTDLNYQYLTLNNLIPWSGFPGSYQLYQPCTTIHGSDFTDIGSHGNCFAIQADISVVTAEANKSHVYWQGVAPLGALVDDDGNQLQFSINEMIRNATMRTSNESVVTVKEFIRNPNTLVEVHKTGSDIDLGSIMGESISYVVFPRQNIPVQVSTGPNVPANPVYTVACSYLSNWVVWPKKTPASMALTGKYRLSSLQQNIHGKSHWKDASRIHNFRNLRGSFMDRAKSMFSDIDWKKWATVALELAPMLASPEEPQGMVYPEVYLVNLVNNIPLNYTSADPEVQKVITELYQCQAQLKALCSGHEYMCPEVVWQPPKMFVVAGDKRSTWNNLCKNTLHPTVALGLDVDFILTDSTAQAVSWFNEFILCWDDKAESFDMVSEISRKKFR